MFNGPKVLDHEPDELREAFDSVMAHPGAMEALTYDLGGTVLLAQHWEEDPSMVLKQIEVLQSVSTAPAIAGPFAAVAADYHARYAYTPEAVAPAEAELRVVHTGYVAPYWYGFPHHRNYLERLWVGIWTPRMYASISYAPFAPR